MTLFKKRAAAFAALAIRRTQTVSPFVIEPRALVNTPLQPTEYVAPTPSTLIGAGPSMPLTVMALDTAAVLGASPVCGIKLKAFGVVSTGTTTAATVVALKIADTPPIESAALTVVLLSVAIRDVGWPASAF